MAKKSALIILDGFGITAEKRGNAVMMANKPYLDLLIRSYPKCLLATAAEEVGLPWGEFGNSEVGHTNMGLGRVVLQDLPQIDKALESGEIFLSKQAIRASLEYLKKNGGALNIIFIASSGGVHGHIRHISPIIKAFRSQLPNLKIRLHLIADGRDAPENSIGEFLGQISPLLDENTSINSLSGRYFAMDRDKNYDRTIKALDAIMGQSTMIAQDVNQAIKTAYDRGETDEFIIPTVIGEKDPPDPKRDVFLFTNYRPDRALQLTRAFTDPTVKINGEKANFFLTMTTYDDNLNAKIIFSNLDLYDEENNSLLHPLPEIISKNGLRQFHVAETEKFAHVTYFFSGGIKDPFENQENKIIQSKKVRSYDLFPQMRSSEITDEIVNSSASGVEFIVANYANPDMVGHSGNLSATIKAVEIIDKCLSKIIPALLENQFSIFITSDHGNADQMIDLKNGKIDKEHSINPAPLIYITESNKKPNSDILEFYNLQPIGVLADVAPTILDDMQIQVPAEFNGTSLLNSLS